jgi:hypothetical protein
VRYIYLHNCTTTLLSLLEQLARRVAAVAPLRGRNTPQATLALFRYKLEKMVGPVSQD